MDKDEEISKVYKSLLSEQLLLAKYGNIAYSDTEMMIVPERRRLVMILEEHLSSQKTVVSSHGAQIKFR